MTGVNPLYFIVGMALLGLAPFFLMMVTSYVKIVVVTSLVRNALGVQQVPPAMVMNGLAIILSLFIMAPMMMSTMDIAEKLQISAEPSPKEVIGIVDKLSPPLRKFLSDNTEDGVLRGCSLPKPSPVNLLRKRVRRHFEAVFPRFCVRWHLPAERENGPRCHVAVHLALAFLRPDRPQTYSAIWRGTSTPRPPTQEPLNDLPLLPLFSLPSVALARNGPRPSPPDPGGCLEGNPDSHRRQRSGGL